MIKIISGWTNPGGSTTAFINLVNLFNNNSIESVLYGPHKWHLNKCNSGLIEDVNLKCNDILIFHFFNNGWKEKPKEIKKLIFSSHEKYVFPISSINYHIYDAIHYVSKKQRDWHKVNHSSFVIPNVLNNLNSNKNNKIKRAGIIGSIDRNKQTHKSIEKAIQDGHKEIILFGIVTDMVYYKEFVEPFLNRKDVYISKPIYCEDKQKMYDMITDVYHSSLSETWGYVEKECELTGVRYHGNDSTKGNFNNITNEQILNMWKKEICLE